MTRAASSIVATSPTGTIRPSASVSTGIPAEPPDPDGAASLPPLRASSRAPTTKTLPVRAATASATDAASSAPAPLAAASAASQTQHATPNDAVPVSTSRTGTPAPRDATRAASSVLDTEDPRWTDRISEAPSAS